MKILREKAAFLFKNWLCWLLAASDDEDDDGTTPTAHENLFIEKCYTNINAFHMNMCIYLLSFFVWSRIFTEKRDSMNKFISFKKKTEFFLFFSSLYSFVLFFCPHFLLFMNIVCVCIDFFLLLFKHPFAPPRNPWASEKWVEKERTSYC